MPEAESMILPPLREIRAEMNRRFDSVDSKLSAHDGRFDRLEGRLDNVRQATIGESVLGRYAVAEVEERLDAIEKRLAALEHQNGEAGA